MNKNQERIIDFLKANPGYLKTSKVKLASKLKVSIKDVAEAKKQLKTPHIVEIVKDPIKKRDIGENFTVLKSTEFFNRRNNKDNVLFVADLHAPWILDGYLDWCKEQQEKYNCGTVIFSGDILDSGAWSYHEHDPDGLSVRDELYAAKKQLKKVFKLFPIATSLYGNHDLLISRKMKTAGLSQNFMKDFGEVLEAPKTWNFVHELVKDNIKYIHGSYGNAFKRAVDSRMSHCQGHLHSQAFVQWSVSEKDAIFGLQVGAGFDRDQYAFDYAKPFPKKPIISCGLVLDKGTTPIVKIMPL